MTKIVRDKAAAADSPPEMYNVKMIVTPDEARELLGGDAKIRNRPLNRNRVQAYARDIANGEWKLSFQGIAFSPAGALLDGQHRLQAIIAADTPAELMVWFDVPESLFPNIDTGRSRSTSFSIGTRPRDAAVAGLVYSLLQLDGDVKQYVSNAEKQKILTWLGPALDAVEAATATRARKLDSAPVRLACAARLFQGQGEYALRVYRDMTRRAYREVPPVAMSLIEQIDRGKTSSSKNQLDLLARAWIAFDPERAENEKIQIKSIEHTLAEVFAALERGRDAPDLALPTQQAA